MLPRCNTTHKGFAFEPLSPERRFGICKGYRIPIAITAEEVHVGSGGRVSGEKFCFDVLYGGNDLTLLGFVSSMGFIVRGQSPAIIRASRSSFPGKALHSAEMAFDCRGETMRWSREMPANLKAESSVVR